MLSRLFKVQPVVDEANQQWIFDSFAWCVAQLKDNSFQTCPQLILTETLYPKNIRCTEAIAEKVLISICQYTGIPSSLITLTPVDYFPQHSLMEQEINNLTHSSITKAIKKPFFATTFYNENHLSGSNKADKNTSKTLDIPYHSSQVEQPDEFITYLVKVQLDYLIKQKGIPTPLRHKGYQQTSITTIDLIACFMGFGFIFTKTAESLNVATEINEKNKAKMNLPSAELIYALALFCAINDCDIKNLKQEFSSDLYKLFVKAYKEVSLYLQKTNNPAHMLKQVNHFAALKRYTSKV
ncbi:hypothetical protein [Colwellia sp. E2M01]|uniref:hypothetical protein n=1 Tax=Colwellia sp. E2M01 TaxID=2841561 RepID=UPI001C092B5E|nr:hypothetical protein [Colwellia sp. E2M01]MBU2869798.1 hypothetical protein [Colwellia sp. E2M01]